MCWDTSKKRVVTQKLFNDFPIKTGGGKTSGRESLLEKMTYRFLFTENSPSEKLLVPSLKETKVRRKARDRVETQSFSISIALRGRRLRSSSTSTIYYTNIDKECDRLPLTAREDDNDGGMQQRSRQELISTE